MSDTQAAGTTPAAFLNRTRKAPVADVRANDPLSVQSGAIVHLQSGAKLIVGTGAAITPEGGVQATAISDVATAGSATAAANATAINSILAALRKAGIVATS